MLWNTKKKNHSSDTFLNLKCIKSRVTKIIAVLFFFGQITPYPFFSTCTSCWLTLGYLICFYVFLLFYSIFFRIFFVELLKADLKSRSIKYLLLCEFNLLVTKFWILEIFKTDFNLTSVLIQHLREVVVSIFWQMTLIYTTSESLFNNFR